MSFSFPGDLANTVLTATMSLPPATRTSSGNGTAIDLLDAEGLISAILQVGTVTGTSPTLDVVIKESDTSGGTYTAIPGMTFTQVTATPNPATTMVLKSSGQRTKRYVRAEATIGGTSPSFPCSVTIVARKKITGSGTGYIN